MLANDGAPILKYQLNFMNLVFNPLNVELTPIYHLLALLGAHTIFYVSRIRFKFV